MRWLKRMVRKLAVFFSIDIINTFRINIIHLPFKHGRKFPILLFKSSLHLLDNAYVKLDMPDEMVRFGMIKIGCRYSKNVMKSHGVQIDLKNGGGIIFHGSCLIGNGSNVITRKGGQIVFGRNVSINGNFSICSFDKIVIGDNLSCSWGVSIYDTDFHETIDATTGTQLEMAKPVFIGNNCWLCQKCTILKGAVLRDWTTVGALALVNRDFSALPANSVVAGVPAKVLSKQMYRKDKKIICFAKGSWYITSGLTLLNSIPSRQN